MRVVCGRGDCESCVWVGMDYESCVCGGGNSELCVGGDEGL